MKKINLIVVGLLATASVSAQTTIASVGFESGDKKYTTETAYTPGGTFGNWVNRQENDVWNEQYADEAHSGEYAFLMQNDPEHAGARWERGFVMGNLQLKDNTPYRVSFWVKGPSGASVKSSMNIGHEYCDKAIGTASGQEYLFDYVHALNGDWQRFSYITFFTNKADQDAYAEGYAGKEDPNGDYPMPAGSPFPEEYNIIINCYNGGDYILDDIKIEEGVTFNTATFTDDVIKLDFGYPTNIADLAKANAGNLSLDPSCVSVTIDGENAPVEFVEGKEDGFLYIFLNTYASEDQKVVVNFTPAADCPIIYNTDKRPSADVESEMKVLGFTNEVAYFDPSIDVLPAAWSPAEMVSSNPENESFEIVGATFKNIAVTYNKALELSTASATLSKNGVNTDLTGNMSLSEDGLTINVAVSGLADGEYTLTLSGVTNIYGVPCDDDQVITFALGADTDTSVSEDVFVTDFDNQMTDGVPEGWVTYNAAGFHIYGFNDEERTSQYNYGWSGTPGGGGARLYAGFSGDFNKALYWGSRETTEGYAEFGSQVKDWLQADGTFDPDMPEGISLKLAPRKYQISFTMAAWKEEPIFRFTLEDLAGNVYAKFEDYKAVPNMNGKTGEVRGALKCVTDFTVPEEGYYVLRFAAQDAEWQEFLLANVKLVTMPSKAAYWKQQLAAAVEKAEPIMEEADDASYDGETKTAFAAALKNAKEGHFTSPSEITALINELDELGAKMQARVKNIDDFGLNVIIASAAYDDLEGKYVNAEIAKNAKELLDQYKTINSSTLSDEELAEVTPKIVTAAAQLANVKDVVNVLTWRGYKAYQAAKNLNVTSTIKDEMLNLVTDNDAKIDQCNVEVKKALYDLLAKNPDILAGDPDALYESTNEEGEEEEVEKLKTSVMYNDGQKVVEDGEYVDKTSADEATNGIDLSCFVKNPKLYTYQTNSGAKLENNSVVGWNVEQYEGGDVHLRGDDFIATAEKPVVTTVLNAYGGGAEYNFYQVIENVPAGVYDVYIATRTALKNKADENGVVGVFNAANDETGVWDKYIYAQVDDEEPIMTPFAAGGSWTGHPTVVKNVTVKDGQKLTIGVVEHMVSGKASNHDYAATDYWDTNTFASDARLYFVAPIPGYDYAGALKDIETAIEAVGAAPAANSNATYNLAGQRVDASYKGIVIKNGKKYLVK